MTPDEFDILQMYGRYGQALWDRRFDDWADQFTADAVLENRYGTFRGRDAVRQFAHTRFSELPRRRIFWCNPVLTVDGEGAAASTDYVVLVEGDEPGASPSIFSMGRYDDTLRKVGDRWLIAERHASS
jgi:hypothetical protein